MKTIREQSYEKATVRLLETKDGYAGIVISKGVASPPVYGLDADDVWQQILSQVREGKPSYFGYDGAVARFVRAFPEGFASEAYLRDERSYKLAAASLLNEAVPLETASNPSAEDCLQVAKAYGKTNMLSIYEHARVREVLKSASGPTFVQGAASVAGGDFTGGFHLMSKAMVPFGPLSWPAATYLPFLWRPDGQMFLKPQVTCDFAERVGSPFAQQYGPKLEATVYEALLALVSDTRLRIADLKPADAIDIQSFIWVVGAYTEEDIATAAATGSSAC